jgi:hypothetical protein
MPLSIVDLLKVIEIEHQNSSRRMESGSSLNLTVQEIQDSRPVRNASEDIVGRSEAEILASPDQIFLKR